MLFTLLYKQLTKNMPNYSTQLKALYDGYVQRLENMNKHFSQDTKIQIEQLFVSLEVFIHKHFSQDTKIQIEQVFVSLEKKEK